MNCNFIKSRTAELVSRLAAGTALNIEQSHCCQDIPRTELPLILVLTIAITMFSVRASMVMHVKNKDNTEKDFNVTQSMYFQYKNDKWVCTEMTNADITAPVGEVRLSFYDNNGNLKKGLEITPNVTGVMVEDWNKGWETSECILMDINQLKALEQKYYKILAPATML